MKLSSDDCVSSEENRLRNVPFAIGVFRSVAKDSVVLVIAEALDVVEDM